MDSPLELSHRIPIAAADLRDRILEHTKVAIGKNLETMTADDWYRATALACREVMAPLWLDSHARRFGKDAKQVYYLSMEFLIGRSLSANLVNLGLYETCRQAFDLLGLDWKNVIFTEPEAGLGNGGLGRLAACLVESMSTVGIPAWGYGLRYDYGMFHQRIDAAGRQVEEPDNWQRSGNPWEFQRDKLRFEVQFGGRVIQFHDVQGRLRNEWIDGERVLAVGRDQAVPGYDSDCVNTIRLWKAEPTSAFDLKAFNVGDYIEAVRDGIESQNLSRILYPDDSTHSGKELRFKQEYFLVSASLQDILRRFFKSHAKAADLPAKAAIQLNDTHPALAVPELMRLLIDIHDLGWDEAWDICVATFGYTNHTVLPEALETWPAGMFERLLPRHWQIVCEINWRFLERVRASHPGDYDLPRRVSIVDEDGGRRVRMAHLAFVGSHRVNGVAAVHTDLIREGIFRDLDACLPGRIVNRTNGVTPRRWLMLSNRGLSALLDDGIGKAWRRDLNGLRDLVPLADDDAFRAALAGVKRANKLRLAQLVKETTGIALNADTLFDVQVKRIHEYKRQLLNVLHVVTLYNRIKGGALDGAVPRTVIFGGKAAPAYHMAKAIIWLINDVARVVNANPQVNEWLRVAFVPNFNVSAGQILYPGADLSEQISTAGTEASGTGNMKFAMNGALTIGTMDGANIEMSDAIGADNMFFFGLSARDANAMRRERRQRPWDHYDNDAELRAVLDMIADGYFSPTERHRHRAIVDSLRHHDEYLLLTDYRSYLDCQERVARTYRDTVTWNRMAVLNIAGTAPFSSDRTVRDYARDIWGIDPRR